MLIIFGMIYNLCGRGEWHLPTQSKTQLRGRSIKLGGTFHTGEREKGRGERDSWRRALSMAVVAAPVLFSGLLPGPHSMLLLRWHPLKKSSASPSPLLQHHTKVKLGAGKGSARAAASADEDGRSATPQLGALELIKKPALVALLVGILLSQAPDLALAASSGGMMGGRSFSSGSRSSSSASGFYTTTQPRARIPFSVPYSAPSPFFGGGLGPNIYVGPAYGIGLGGGGTFFVLLLGFLAFYVVSGFLSDRSDGSVVTATRKTSVLKLQVGLLGMARSLQRDLDRLASSADTSSPRGIHFVLTETVLTLLRHPDYWISGYSSSDIKRTVEAGEQRFNELSLDERGKFDEETLVNVDNLQRRSSAKGRSSGLNNEYIVVTVLVAAEGEHKLPTINSNSDLKDALRKLGSIPIDQTLAVEVLWTPQDENDTISERELLLDYPLLRPL